MSPSTASTLRQRRRPKEEDSSVASAQDVDQSEANISGEASSRRKITVSRPEYWTLLVGLAGGVIITIGFLLLSNYRVHQVSDDDSLLDTARALEHIRVIAKKRRFVGTKALEDSLQYIEQEIIKMRPLAESNGMRLDVHTFRSSPGSFATSVGKRYFINSYDDLPSVVARLRPSNLGEGTQEESLLINAHVDSAIGAFGANDNVLGVGTVMELIRSLSRMETSVNALKRPVVFLFNGAEEAVLMAAHSFVEQHPWAPTARAHINIESLGSGDSYFLFRLGPNNPWLAKAYARAVSVPSASVTANDIFSSRMIPAETDYRVFDEFGGIPGYDFVMLDNGYIYHTDYDSVDNIDVNAVKHGGILFRELTLELAGKNDAIGAFLNGSERTVGFQQLLSRSQ